MKKVEKALILLAIGAAAVFAVGVVKNLKAIKDNTKDPDDYDLQSARQDGYIIDEGTKQ